MSRADQFPPLAPSRAERWATFGHWDTVYFPQLLGLEIEELRTDYARMRLAYRPEFRQPAGVVHGGVIATMLDTAVVPAIGSGYDEHRDFFTIDMQVRFLSAIRDEDAVAEGWIVRRGRSVIFCDSEVQTASGRVAATASLTYTVASPRS